MQISRKSPEQLVKTMCPTNILDRYYGNVYHRRVRERWFHLRP